MTAFPAPAATCCWAACWTPGCSLADLEADLAQLAVGGYELAAQRVTRRGLTGTHLRVLAGDGERPARTLPAIRDIIGRSDLL